MPFPQHDPLVHKHLFHSLIFGHARKYFKATRALAPFSPAPTSFDTTLALTALHPNSNGYFSPFLEKYEPNQNFELSSSCNWHSKHAPSFSKWFFWDGF
jgi:hypothetical protein